MHWKTFFKYIAPMIETAGQEMIDADDNDYGKDDIQGVGIVYAVKILRAIVGGKSIPKAPDILK